MKKIILISLFLFPLSSYASFGKDLYYGVWDDAEVQALQEFLADQGHYVGTATGNFFSLTLSAVKKFQTANRISPASGYFGPKTRAKANQILESEGVSADSVKNEDNAPVSASVVAPKTNTDIVTSLANQIPLLQQQLATLQKNQDALQQQNQSLQTIQQQQSAQTQQTQQSVQQIQQNITPPSSPGPVIPPTPIGTLKISSVNVVPDMTSAKIEWATNQPTESKLYLSGGGLTSKLFVSETGYSTNHFSNISQLTPVTDYSFRITAIGNTGFTDVFGGFKTKIPPPIIKFDQSSHGISMGAQDKISWKSSYVESCTASGAWSGVKSINGEELVSFNQMGVFTYNLACTGLSGGVANATLMMTVVDHTPRVAISTSSDTPSGGVAIKGVVDLPVFKLNIKRVSGEKFQLREIQVRLVGGNSLAKNKIKGSWRTTLLPQAVNGEILTYSMSPMPDGGLWIDGDGVFQFIFKADIPESANEAETFILEFIGIGGTGSGSGIGAKFSGVAISKEFSIGRSQQ